MHELLSDLIDQCHRKYIKGKVYNLTIEIFLPRSLLYYNVEKWDYKDEEKCRISIGTKHSVVVRSYERLNKPSCMSDLGEKWIKVKKLWDNFPTEEEFITLSENNFDRNKLRADLDNKIGVKVACDPSNSKVEELYSAIHSAGIPIMLLLRREVVMLKNIVSLTNYNWVLYCNGRLIPARPCKKDFIATMRSHAYKMPKVRTILGISAIISNSVADPNGRRLFVIISDCVSSAWRSGAIAKALAVWACSSPTAIIQVLPEWLWVLPSQFCYEVGLLEFPTNS